MMRLPQRVRANVNVMKMENGQNVFTSILFNH